MHAERPTVTMVAVPVVPQFEEQIPTTPLVSLVAVITTCPPLNFASKPALVPGEDAFVRVC
jgi:hypothetical protein